VPPSTPFVDRGTGKIDTNQLLREALPLGKLIGVFVGISLVPFAVGFLLGSQSPFGLVFTVIGQFVLAVGSGIVLMYSVSRGLELSDRTE